MLSCLLGDISFNGVLAFGGTLGIYLMCSEILHKQAKSNARNRGFGVIMTLLVREQK